MAGRLAAEMAWTGQAGCRTEDPNLWFPVEAESNWPLIDEVVLARRICAACPVFTQCHAWGMAHETEGIWAGTGPGQRRRLRKALGIHLETIQTFPFTTTDPLDPDEDTAA